jgi:hypothetical protein
MADASVRERIGRGLREEVEAEEPDLAAEALIEGEEDEDEDVVGITETEDDEDVVDLEEADEDLDVEAVREAVAQKQWAKDVHEFGVRNAEVLQAVRPPLMELGWKVNAFTSKDNDKNRVLTIQLTGRSAFAQLGMPYDGDGDGAEPWGKFENAPKGKEYQVGSDGVVQVEGSAEEEEEEVDEEEVERVGVAGLGPESEFDPEDLPEAPA